MEETRFLRLVLPPKEEVEKAEPHSDPLFRFTRIVLNLASSALDCLNRISQQEMGKSSPSCALLEEYYLLHHHLDFIKRLCEAKRT